VIIMKHCIIFLALLYVAILFIPLTIGRTEGDGDGKHTGFAGQTAQIRSLVVEHRRTGIHDGNLVRSSFTNFGNLGNRTSEIRGEWPKDIGMNYLSESTFYIAAEAKVGKEDFIYIITDSYTGGPRDRPINDSHTYSWQPLPGYYNEGLDNLNDYPAMSHLPETWPHTWPNRSDEWNGKWIGEFGPYAIANQESYYVMDDRDNDEFPYYPFIGSSLDSLPWPDGRRGLGVKVEMRGYQWEDPRLDDVWFNIYDITNVSHKDLNKLVSGFYQDFDVGNNWGDFNDSVAVDTTLGLVYQWNKDGYIGDRPTYYIGNLIFETPDDLGLTSFYGTSAGNVLSDDEKAWNRKINPGIFKPTTGGLDIAFITGSGYFSLVRGETKRYAIALVWGYDEENLFVNAKYAKWFYDGGYRFDVHTVTVVSPSESDVLNSITEIRWSADSGDSLLIDIFYSIDDWQTWRLIAEDEENDGIFLWDTQSVEDGINYSIIVVAHDHSGMGQSLTTGHFTINNPLPARPEVFIASPVSGDVISGIHNISWRAGDADDDAVILNLYYSQDNGLSWNLFASNLLNDRTYLWDTTPLPNGVNYTLKITISDGTLEGMDIMDGSFQIENSHPLILPQTVEHVSGIGDGKVGVHVIDETLLTGHSYELTFSVSEDLKTYSVFDLDLGRYVLENIETNNNMEGPIFDGVRLWIKDYLEAESIDSLTGWITSDANLEIKVEKDPGYKAIALPADFEIRVLGLGADTSYSAIPRFRTPVNFQVWNVTDSIRMEFTFKEREGPDSTFSAGDELIPIINRADRRYNPTWKITFDKPRFEELILPDSGDVAFIAIAKPFSEKDVFRFKTLKDYIVSIPPANNMDRTFSLTQNYPNPFNTNTIIEYTIPKTCYITLKIYDILGREVITLLKQRQEEGIHRIKWNGCDQTGHILPSGVYFYRINAGEYVEVRKAILLR
jgi:hypothetical protein